MTFNQVVRGSSPRWLTKAVDNQVCRFFIGNHTKQIRGYGGIGRRARFRFWWETVQVQVLLSAAYGAKPEGNGSGFALFSVLRIMVTDPFCQKQQTVHLPIWQICKQLVKVLVLPLPICYNYYRLRACALQDGGRIRARPVEKVF